MSMTKDNFFNEINDHNEEEILQSLDHQEKVQKCLNYVRSEQKEQNSCDICGYLIEGIGHPVYDENFNKQPGLVQCKFCQANLPHPNLTRPLPF